MEVLKTWIASSQLILLASRSTLAVATRARARVRCCSSSSFSAVTDECARSIAADGNQRSDRRRRSSSSTSDRESIREIRLQKVEELRSRGYEPYAYKWDRSHKARQLQDIYAHLENGEQCKDDSVSVAGRVIASRKFGKLAFCTLKDESGTIQLYFEKESLPEDQFELLKTFIDIGDILGASGSIKKTDKGELSVFVKFVKILTKSLLPLPDKYHGLADVDKRYRQRYVDMIANPEVASIFRMRAEILSEIRRTMDSWGFIEIETPVLQGAAGGAEARPFITYHNSLERNLYLRIATELHLKRMLVGGFEKVFEIGRIFRNEGISSRHNPEFTTIEMYEALSDYESMMDKAEEIITRCALRVHGKLKINYLGTEICFQRPWKRETMCNLVNEATGVDFGQFKNDLKAAKEAAKNILRATGDDYDALVQACPSVGHVFNEVFEIIVVPKLLQPTFVLDYPVEISPLAKPHRGCPGLVERFELFIYGRELANSFSELTDPIDQKTRLMGQIEQHNKRRAAFADQKRENDDYSYDVSLDEDFITALEYGMPPASGMGLGIDRLVMLLTNSASIRDVIAFPVLKSQQ
ncbi:lysine--tRNA ligase, chloroplastic/mitochondrial [Phalaenopsis equestris]|uniref:lysine--tRNA ligase, chloroplastic/mitochondrial n=1 Tax=Phalaenopsis equestris TaxID=78828 RepID=UPI0009E39419|nr:lysine--tRNA ligase, chloroplastic/mitochondrial [Phalaenopsis equestris]